MVLNRKFRRIDKNIKYGVMYQQTHINASPTQNIGKLTGIVILKLLLFLYYLFQEFSVQITFREQWNDERLKFDDYKGRSYSCQ